MQNINAKIEQVERDKAAREAQTNKESKKLPVMDPKEPKDPMDSKGPIDPKGTPVKQLPPPSPPPKESKPTVTNTTTPIQRQTQLRVPSKTKPIWIIKKAEPSEYSTASREISIAPSMVSVNTVDIVQMEMSDSISRKSKVAKIGERSGGGKVVVDIFKPKVMDRGKANLQQQQSQVKGKVAKQQQQQQTKWNQEVKKEDPKGKK